MGGEAWKLAHEAFGHGASTVRKQRELSVGIHLVLSLCVSNELSHGMVPPIFRMDFYP